MDIRSQQLKEQRAYTSSLAKGVETPLASTNMFWLSMTSTYFRNPAQAEAEILDNSIQSGADKAFIEVIPSKDGNSSEKIITIDNGCGMDPVMMSNALSFGGTQRHNKREGTGRFGMGMPNSLFTQGDKVTIFSKPIDGKVHSLEFDGRLLQQGKYTKKNGEITLPFAQPANLPKDIEDILSKNGVSFDQGTIIVLEGLSRIKIKRPAALIEHYRQHLGTIFNKQLAVPSGKDSQMIGKFNLIIDGTPVKPSDPLFLTPGALGYDDDSSKAKPFQSLKIAIDQNGVKGIIRCEFSLLEPTFWLKDKNGPTRSKKNQFGARFEIAKQYEGINIYRHDRLIDTVSIIPRYVWPNAPRGAKTKWLNNDRTVRVAIHFEPILDEFFGVEVTKQQAMPNDRIWNTLKDQGFFKTISGMTAEDEARRKNDEVSDDKDEDGRRPSEVVRDTLAEINKTNETETQKQFKNDEGQKGLQQEAKKNVEKLGQEATSENISAQKDFISKNLSSNKFKVMFESLPGAPFFRFGFLSGTFAIWINEDHSFYKNLYGHHSSNRYIRSALDIFLGTLSERMSISEESRDLFKRDLRLWSEALTDELDLLNADFSDVKEIDDTKNSITANK